MIKIASILLRMIIGGSFVLFAGVSCTQSESEEELNDYLAAVDAEEQQVASNTLLPPARVGSHLIYPATDHIEGGVPILKSSGYCGDGIIDNSEQCDKNAILTTNCSDLGGIAGRVKCTDRCLFDISECMTDEMNVLMAGRTEICYSACDNSSCEGGCVPISGNATTSECTFICKRNCVSACEGTVDMDVESCTINCSCQVTGVTTVAVQSGGPGFPDCDCVMDDCYIRVGIAPNIAEIVSDILPRY